MTNKRPYHMASPRMLRPSTLTSVSNATMKLPPLNFVKRILSLTIAHPLNSAAQEM